MEDAAASKVVMAAWERNGLLRGVLRDDANWRERTAALIAVHEAGKIIMGSTHLVILRAINAQGTPENRWLARKPADQRLNRTVVFEVRDGNIPAFVDFACSTFDELELTGEPAESAAA